MRLLIDMDGVLADFDDYFNKIWSERFPTFPQIPGDLRDTYYLDDFLDKLGGYGSMSRTIIKEKGFFASLPPQPGALKGIQRLKNMGIEFYICTAPLVTWTNCVSEKFEWVERWLGHEATKKLILTRNKALVQADYLLDDDPARKDSADACWKQILFQTPYSLYHGLPAVDWTTFFDLSLFGGSLDTREFCIPRVA